MSRWIKEELPEYLAWIFGVTLAVGVLSKWSLWPFATLFILLGGFGFLLVNLLRLILRKRKKPEHYFTFLVTEFWVLYLVFKLSEWPFASGLLVVAGITTCAWTTFLIFDYFIKASKKRKTLLEIVSQIWWVVAAVLILVGAVFKIQHWPFATPLLGVGFILGIAWAIINLFVPIQKEEDPNIDENY
jgi:hypothetical protein